MELIRRCYLIVRTRIIVARFKRWSDTCKCPMRKEMCKTLYPASLYTYNLIKFKWMKNLKFEQEQ